MKENALRKAYKLNRFYDFKYASARARARAHTHTQCVCTHREERYILEYVIIMFLLNILPLTYIRSIKHNVENSMIQSVIFASETSHIGVVE